MARLGIIIFIACLLVSGCRKKSANPLPEDDPAPLSDNPLFKCKDVPPPPAPYGWHDTTVNVNHNINTFMFNPLNPNEAIIVVNGDAFGYNKMLCYNIQNKTGVFLANVDDYVPSVNKKGWVLFSTADNNIYKIKCNGDSLTLLIKGNTAKDPKWDNNGNYFYYYLMAFNFTPSQLVYANADGVTQSVMVASLPNSAPFNNSNKIIYQKTKDNYILLTLKNIMAGGAETTLITGPFNHNVTYFDNLCLDNKDEYFYWSNSGGVYRCSLSTLKTELMFANCANVEYMNPIFQASRPNEILLACHFIRPVLPFDLFHDYKAAQINLLTNERTIVGIFP